MTQRKKVAIIVAGGSGTRMQSALPKQFLDLCGRPVLYYTIAAFADAFPDMHIILVLPEAHFEKAEEVLGFFETRPHITLVKGGETRFHSVKNGLLQAGENAVVFVHDGVRPLVTPSLIRNCYEAAIVNGSAIPVVDMKDSIRQVIAGNNRAVDREQYKIVQTPQTFLSEIILRAFEQSHDPLFTDEATVAEHMGHFVHLVEGEESNIKITRPLDLIIAAALLQERG